MCVPRSDERGEARFFAILKCVTICARERERMTAPGRPIRRARGGTTERR
jgi:hypothetical protein